MKQITLYRPVGQKEFDLIKTSGFKRFPPRLEWQPIFYPVMNQQYAEQIANDWNTNDAFSGYIGYVLAFDMNEDFLQKYAVQNVGSEIHNELWVPAEELEEFNDHIIADIRVLKIFKGDKHQEINKIKGALFGLAIGDALGVPAEFNKRNQLKIRPVTDMTGYGTWNQPPGTWSDDSSLAFCLAETIAEGYSKNNLALKFIKWMNEGYWGARHSVFDIGITTRSAISRLAGGVAPELAGGIFEEENGNGSLMRILPLVFLIENLAIEQRFALVKEVSSLTHAHFRSVFACFIYTELGTCLLKTKDQHSAYSEMKRLVNNFIEEHDFEQKEIHLFSRILRSDITNIPADEINSSGYVIHTLEAAIWCLLNSQNYADAVLTAVNLGEDTDTTACVTGGLAGIVYGFETIPDKWISMLARADDISKLSENLNKKITMKETA